MNGDFFALVDDGFARYSDRVVGNLHLGAVAQLGEHHNGIVGVKGSSPFSSTKTETGRDMYDRSHYSDNQGGTAEIPSSLKRRGDFLFSPPLLTMEHQRIGYNFCPVHFLRTSYPFCMISR